MTLQTEAGYHPHSHPTLYSPEGSTQTTVPEKARTFCLSQSHHILLKPNRTGPGNSYGSCHELCMDCTLGYQAPYLNYHI